MNEIVLYITCMESAVQCSTTFEKVVGCKSYLDQCCTTERRANDVLWSRGSLKFGEQMQDAGLQ